MSDLDLEGITVEKPVDWPSDEQIAQWKEKYGGIYKLKMSNTKTFIYRGVTRSEHKGLKGQIDPQAQQVDQDWLDEEVVKMAVLYPVITKDNIDSTMSGEVPTMAEEIMKVSGYLPEGKPERL